jgi:hypothetical protein
MSPKMLLPLKSIEPLPKGPNGGANVKDTGNQSRRRTKRRRRRIAAEIKVKHTLQDVEAQEAIDWNAREMRCTTIK